VEVVAPYASDVVSTPMATAMAVSVLKADSLSIVEDPAGHQQAHPQSSKGYAINCNQELFL
jgi:hypothetical protein